MWKNSRFLCNFVFIVIVQVTITKYEDLESVPKERLLEGVLVKLLPLRRSQRIALSILCLSCEVNSSVYLKMIYVNCGTFCSSGE